MSVVQRQACKVLMRKGNIDWILHPEQKKLLAWLDERRREISVICISRQWGKTFMLLAYCIAFAIRNPKTTTLLLAPHLVQLQTIILPRANQIMQYLPEDVLPHRRENVWIFPNGSIVRLDGVSVNRGIRIRGDALDLCVMDEVRDINHLEEMITAHISPMFTTTNGKLVLISTPPDSPAHAFTSKFIKEAIERGDFYSATYKQNPLLSTTRLRYLTQVLHPGGEENIIFRREYMADYSVSDPEKRVIREWNEAQNDEFFNGPQGSENEGYKGPKNPVRPYLAMDYAHSDPCGLVAGWWDAMAGCLVIMEEHFERHMNTTEVGTKIVEMATKIKAMIPAGSPDMLYVMDVDPSLMSDLWSMFGLRFEPANKVGTGFGMNSRLRVAFLEGRIRIHPNCVQTRYQLKTGIFNAKGTDYLRTERTGHLDLIDALKYLVTNMRWNELPRAQVPEAGLKSNQMYVGPFRTTGNFKSNIIRRPI